MAKSGSNVLFWLLILIGIAAIGWMFRDLLLPQPEIAAPVTAPVESVAPR